VLRWASAYLASVKRLLALVITHYRVHFVSEKERKSPGFEFTPLSRTFALAKEKMPGFKNVALHARVCCL